MIITLLACILFVLFWPLLVGVMLGLVFSGITGFARGTRMEWLNSAVAMQASWFSSILWELYSDETRTEINADLEKRGLGPYKP